MYRLPTVAHTKAPAPCYRPGAWQTLRGSIHMAQTTHAEATGDTPTGYGYCSWHGGVTAGVRLIDVIEQNSGSSPALFACQPCRETHGLVPFADLP